MNRPILKKLLELKEKPVDYSGLISDFLEKPRLSYSSLKHFAKSPWHFIEYKVGDKKESKAFDIGNTFELFLLEPEKADELIVEMPSFSGKGSVQAKKDFLEQNKGKLCVTAKELDAAFEMFQRAIQNEDVLRLLEEKAAIQEKIYWKDPHTKLRSLSILDMRSDWNIAQPWICDLKTGRSAERFEFPRAIFNFDYLLQAGGYVNGVNYTEFVYPDFYWLVVENTPPYGINLFRADSEFIAEAKRYYLELLKAFKYCMDHNLWHQSHDFWRFMSPYESVQKPFWHKTKI